MDLLAITQAFFMLGFVAMAAGTLYFVLERNDIKPEHRMGCYLRRTDYLHRRDYVLDHDRLCRLL